MTTTRRQFLKLSGTTFALASLPLFHFRARAAGFDAGTSRTVAKLESWEDLYRQRWTWDKVVKGSHGWSNCRSACAWDMYVKDGIVVREEQTATYAQSEAEVPDFNPRGCQKGACYTEVMYGPSRVTVPMKRVGERGSGQWERIPWEQAIDEIAEQMVNIVSEWGTDTIDQDLGPNFDEGASTVGRFRFQMKAGGIFPDMWAEIGDLNIGGTLTMGFAHVGGTSDEWFLSDFPVVWMMNPSVTQIPDAHFLFEGRYNGAELTIIDPQYTATTLHADRWIPLRSGTDAALGLAVARYIWESGHMDEAYVREQTDFPILVRLDTGRMLRGEDLLADAKAKKKENVFYLWNPEKGAPEEAPGSEGADKGQLIVNGFVPPIEGTFQVKLLDGSEVTVATVGSIMREHLGPWTIERAAAVTELAPELIEEFAKGFAEAERPMIFSSWGSNRYMHSDLMNRTKLLCLTLKGAIGKRGAGYQSNGFFGLAGFGSSLQLDKHGVMGKLAVMAGMATPKELFEIVVDLAKKKKSFEDIITEQGVKGEEKMVCATSVSAVDYHYQGIKEQLNKDVAGLYPRSLDAYAEESVAKGWDPKLPRKGSPKIFITGGANLIRRTNQTQAFLDNFWPNIELVIGIDKKMNTTLMHADYILPAAGWYEKSGIKYTVSYAPYLHYCDVAVPPLGESKGEWEMFWLLSKRIEEIANERNMPVMDGCGRFDVDWKELHKRYTCGGFYGIHDEETVAQDVLNDSKSTKGMKIENLKKTGIEKFKNAGLDMAPAFQYNPDWKGEGVLSPFSHMIKYKWRWPTCSGRLTYYLDHPWFIEGGEALPTHKESPKAGGDHPFQLVSCHCRWSIHTIWREIPMMLRMQRGEPVLYLNTAEAKKKGLEDHAWAELFNDLGSMRMRIKHSTMVRPGVAYYFHAWEPTQFPEHKSYKWLTPGTMKPLHWAGGQGQLHFAINHFQPGSFVQDTRVGIRPWQGGDEAKTLGEKNA